jgi:hypothetical protein
MAFQIVIISKVPVKPALLAKTNFNTFHVLIAKRVTFGKTLIIFRELEQNVGRVKSSINLSTVTIVMGQIYGLKQIMNKVLQ